MIEKHNVRVLVVHCTDTADDEILTAIDIHKMHLSFGWDGIGYHKIINKNGSIENGRPEYWIGAHAKGINEQSLGVCLIGRNTFNEKQLISLKETLLNWKKKYPNATIKGHRDAIKTKKTCPNFDIELFCKKWKIY